MKNRNPCDGCPEENKYGRLCQKNQMPGLVRLVLRGME